MKISQKKYQNLSKSQNKRRLISIANKVIITGTIYGEMVQNDVGKEDNKMLVNIITRNDYQNREGNFENTFISCVAWNETASFILRNFQSGDPIEIIGSIINESWEKDGIKHYKDRVPIRKVSFVPKQYIKVKENEEEIFES
ncbi:hypothetical protein EEI45_00730 [Erysipelothrix piscisicarius]|uniref:Single-stranded DNA-binding protein n=1 Tax=Erysipelothrix piscisicarius TaxID=2485784 RepID=A0A3S5HJY5_9FIRM|nr:single-stranded DNA-binding protein [Erysipelothrix piscisicarius]AZK43528.1 hypothetical protein EEI45_00730 [Erysipelothrix piscisicarius]